jgi:hypothetical protein
MPVAGLIGCPSLSFTLIGAGRFVDGFAIFLAGNVLFALERSVGRIVPKRSW